MRWIALLLAFAGCKCKGDDCVVGSMRCDGNEVLTCHANGGKTEALVGHTSPYFERTTCPAGTTCIKAGSVAGCADPATACDPVSTIPVVTERGTTIQIRSCTHHINTNAYLETVEYTSCDPKTFVRACVDGQSARACVAGEDLKSTHPPIKEALRGRFVETILYCPVCGTEPDRCNE